MKTITSVYLTSVLVLTLAACDGTKKATESGAEKVEMATALDGVFMVKTVQNKDTSGQTLSLSFDKENSYFNGVTECNGIGSEYTINGNSISFGGIFATKMYCEGKMEAERTMSEALRNTATFSIKNNTLNFYDKEGNVVLSANKE